MGKTLKNFIISATIGTGLFGLGYLLNHCLNKKDHLFQSSRIEILSNSLLLNRDDSIYYVTNKSEEQGIEDILKIINTSDYEEKWLYLPEKQKWYEIGIKSYVNKEWSEVRHTAKDIEIILEKNKGVKKFIIYHNHPLNRDPSPSLADFQGTKIHQQNFPNYKIKEKICSKEGISEYSLTEKAIKDSIKLEDYYFYTEDSSITLNPEYFTINFKEFKKP